MTEEEIKSEAERYIRDKLRLDKGGEQYKYAEIIYLAGAEPREKYIAELKAEVTRLRNENLDIINKYTRFAETDRRTIAELKAQIEKMKVCQNCDNWNWKHNKCEKKLKGDCFKHSKWVMRNF